MSVKVADLSISPMSHRDWAAVRQIYLEGIATGLATFETDAPDWETWHSEHLACCRLIAGLNGQVVGWAALSPVSGRCVYAGVAEVSVYVASDARGQGVGAALLQQLILESEQAGIWTLEAGIFSINKASIALHTTCGFRKVGYRERLGELHGIWRDVVLMERRSSKL
jgi:L-amino acid N-acyltransferase YncA